MYKLIEHLMDMLQSILFACNFHNIGWIDYEPMSFELESAWTD